MITRLKEKVISEEKVDAEKLEEINMMRHAINESDFEERMSIYEAEDEYNARQPGNGIFV